MTVHVTWIDWKEWDDWKRHAPRRYDIKNRGCYREAAEIVAHAVVYDGYEQIMECNPKGLKGEMYDNCRPPEPLTQEQRDMIDSYVNSRRTHDVYRVREVAPVGDTLVDLLSS